MHEIFVTRRYWYVDLTIILFYSAFIGYEIQRTADSGEIRTDKIMQTLLYSIMSYLLGFAIAALWSRRKLQPPYWLTASVLGSVAFAFAYGVWLFVLRSSNDTNEAVLLIESETGFLVGRVVLLALFFTLPLSCILLATRGVLFLLRYLNERMP